jgi:hypothetical protein
MSTTQELYTQSLLAQASYATNLAKGTLASQSQIDALTKNGGSMAIAEANNFATKWTVVDQYNGNTGVSATIFQNIASGTKYLAIRGTEVTFTDIVTDANLAIIGIPPLDPQYIELSSQVKSWQLPDNDGNAAILQSDAMFDSYKI